MKRSKSNMAPYLGIIPSIVLFVTFVLIPILANFYYSLTDYNGFPKSEINFIGLDNFRKIFSADLVYLKGAIKNSLTYAFMITMIQNVLALILAILLSLKIKGSNFFKALYFFPNVMGAFIIGSIWSLLMTSRIGPVYLLFEKLGLSVNFLGDTKTAIFSVIFVQIWLSTGYAMVIYYTNIKSISADIFEAACIDGASLVQTIRHVLLPLISNGFTVNIILSLIGSLKLFEIIFVMTGGGPAFASENLPVYIFRSAFGEGKHGYGAALNVIQFFMIAMISFFALTILKRRENATS